VLKNEPLKIRKSDFRLTDNIRKEKRENNNKKEGKQKTSLLIMTSEALSSQHLFSHFGN